MDFFNDDVIQIEGEVNSNFTNFSTQQDIQSMTTIGLDKNQYGNWQPQSNLNDPFSNYQIVFFCIIQDDDEEEEKRISARRVEEDEKKRNLMQKLNDELRIKQEMKDKAREYLERFLE